MTASPRHAGRVFAATATLAAACLVSVGGPHLVEAAGSGTLALSASEIATGQVLSVSGDGCTSDDTTERSLRSFLLIGEPGSQVAAGSADGLDGAPAPIGVPGWIDTGASAEVHASCIERDADGVAQTAFTYEPLGIDVVPGTGPAPIAAPDRAELAQGQITAIALADCDPAAGGSPDGVVYPGTDLSGQTWGDPVAVAEASGDPAQLTVGPFGLDGAPLASGPYVLVAQCGTEAAGFAASPILLTVTPNAAVATATVAVSDDASSIEATGSGCSEDEVTVTLVAIPSGLLPARTHAARVHQAESVGDVVTLTATPEPDGSWTVTWTPALLDGLVTVDAVCGDPLGSGFAYTPVEAGFRLSAPTTVPTTDPVTPTPPPGAARPAAPVRATVTYAG